MAAFWPSIQMASLQAKLASSSISASAASSISLFGPAFFWRSAGGNMAAMAAIPAWRLAGSWRTGVAGGSWRGEKYEARSVAEAAGSLS